MISLKERLITEEEGQLKLKKASHSGYVNLMNVDGTALVLMAQMTLDWLKNPNKSAKFYSGDGGQLVDYLKSDIRATCQYIIDNSDEEINVYESSKKIY